MDLKFDPENPQYEYVIDETHFNKVMDILEKEKIVGVDVEATGLDPHTSVLLLVQVGTAEKSYLFDTRKLPLEKFERFKIFMENKGIIKILHNGKFDYKFIRVHLGIETDNIFDTMLAEGVLNAGIGKGYYSLKELSQKYANLDLDKAMRISFIGVTEHTSLSEEQLKYGAIDTLVLFPIFECQLQKIKQENLINIAKLEFTTTRAVAEMELKGLWVDEKKWRDIIKNLSNKRDVVAQKFQEEIRPLFSATSIDLFGNYGDSINVNSQVQLMDLFNNKLKLDLPSTGDGILERYDHPVVKLLREYRGYEKLVSAFGESLLAKINPKTKRIHPEFNQLGAATGRFSCNNPNLQQIPRNSEEAPFRECFNPAPGYKLVTADYSQMEMRILADLSNDQLFIGAIKDGRDLHSFTAAMMWNLEYSDDFKKKYPDKRQAAKAINFGLMYGMGPSSLARQIGVTPEEGKEYMNLYFKTYPSVRKFLEKMAKDAVRNGWSSTPAGRKRWYKMPDRSDPDYTKKIGSVERQAKNHPIQGTNADAVKYALVFLNERRKKEGVDASLILTVHDEIVSEVREDQAEYWAKVQSDEMIRAAQLFIKKVPVASDPFVADVWEH